MKQTLTIARRELTSLFFSPIAYVVLGLFTLGTSLLFTFRFGPGELASMRETFAAVVWLMILLVPAISMRAISEEFRSGTIEMLMTSPVTDAQVVLGKWLGAMGFFATLLLPLLAMVVVLEMNGRPDYGPIVTGLGGLLLVGGLYLAIGVLASAMTQNQIIAFLLTVFVILILTLAMYMLPQAQFVKPWMRTVMFHLNVNSQFEEFNKGLIDLTNIVYFVSGIALFLFITTKVLESRRWR